jgi:hypothetical protein
VTNNLTGEISQQIQSYTELEDGMNYLSNGVWVTSQDLVELTSTGTQAVHGQMTGSFSSDITSVGAITLTTGDGEVFQSHPIGLFYTDRSSGKVAQIASVQPSVGTLYPPNIIVFSNVLSGLRADLMLVWAHNGFEQNLVLKQTPPKPESFGLSSSTTTLQMWTAMDSCPVPTEQRPVLLESGLEDHILIFPETWFPVGGAFAFGDTALPPAGQAATIRPIRTSDPGVVPVAKTLVNISGQLVLIEEVRYVDLAPVLSQLPQASVTPNPRKTVELAERGIFLKGATKSGAAKRPLEIASTRYSPEGVVVDYTTLTFGASSYTFLSDNTYYIPNSFEVGPGTAQLLQNACLKFATNAFLMSYGSVSCPSSGSPVVFTSKDDNGFGQKIDGSTANPGYAALEGFVLYYLTNQSTVQNVRIRWAQTAIEYQSSTVNRPQLKNSSLENSLKGIYLDMPSDTLSLTQVSECNVITPIYTNSGHGSVSGTVTTNCGVVSVAMVNDPNRDLSGLDTNKNSQTECSFVVCDSTNIVAAFMNTHLSECELGYTPFPGIPSPRMTSWALSTNAGTNFSNKGPILPISTTTYAGTSITNGASDSMHGDAGDTTMAFDGARNVIYLLVNASREPANWYGARLWTSTDRGQSFNPVNMDVPGLDIHTNHLVKAQDKPMIKLNSTNLYVASSGDDGTNFVWAAHSSNGGTNWDLYNRLDNNTNGDVRGVDIATVQDGTTYFFWLRSDSGSNGYYTNLIRYAWLSTNNIWSAVSNIGQQINSTNFYGSGNPLRFDGDTTADNFEDNAFPHVAYANGNIYIAYADLPSTNNGTKDRGDIFLTEASVNWLTHALSVNYGPRAVNNDRTQTDQWNPSIAMTPSGNELFIGYYSRQNDPTTNSWIMAYGAKAYITNGLANATFESIPISSTQFQPMFAGTNYLTNIWTFDLVWPASCLCLDINALYVGTTNCNPGLCTNWPGGLPLGFSTPATYVNFQADDYTWAASDTNYFYFAWCDRTRTNGSSPHTRPDADIKFAKVQQ